MLNIKAYAKQYKWTQISEPAARKLYNASENIGICPNKCVPSDSPFNVAIIVKKVGKESFKDVINNFVYYLTIETGTYPHFYKLEEIS